MSDHSSHRLMIKRACSQRAFVGSCLLSLGLVTALACSSADQSARTPDGAYASGTAVICNDETAIQAVRKSVVRVSTDAAVGTGIVVAENRIITNAHVVENNANVRVQSQDGAEEGIVIGTDRVVDLALIQTATHALPAVRFADPSSLKPGQRLLALGYALDLPGEPSTTAGIFSALREIDGVPYVQTDAPINPGNSGGPLFSQCGEVVGLNTSGTRTGIGFAINSSRLRTASADLAVGAVAVKPPLAPTVAVASSAPPVAPPALPPLATTRDPDTTAPRKVWRFIGGTLDMLSKPAAYVETWYGTHFIFNDVSDASLRQVMARHSYAYTMNFADLHFAELRKAQLEAHHIEDELKLEGPAAAAEYERWLKEDGGNPGLAAHLSEIAAQIVLDPLWLLLPALGAVLSGSAMRRKLLRLRRAEHAGSRTVRSWVAGAQGCEGAAALTNAPGRLVVTSPVSVATVEPDGTFQVLTSLDMLGSDGDAEGTLEVTCLDDAVDIVGLEMRRIARTKPFPIRVVVTGACVNHTERTIRLRYEFGALNAMQLVTLEGLAA